MLEVKGNYIDYKILSNGNFEVSFEVDKKDRQRLFAGIDKIKGQDLDIKIAKHREKRSLNANAYLWALCDKLAEKLKITDIEVYQKHIREVGLRRQEIMSVKTYSTISVAWGMLGKGWISERIDFNKDKNEGLYNFYYGSSSYNSKQMARLNDSIVEECKLQGIETMPPDDIPRMIDVWEPAKIK